jgi:cytidylate kinase
VMAGRDIGTVVLPGADIKIYLDATVEERARRRWLEERERGNESDLDGVLDAMRRRDEIDSSREVSPLMAAEDAIVVDSTEMSIEQVVAEVERLIATKERACSAG